MRATLWTYADLSCHGRCRVPGVASVRRAAAPGAPGHLRRQLRHRVTREHRAHPPARVPLPADGHRHPVLRGRARRLRLPPGVPGVADRLPAPPAAHAEGRVPRHPPPPLKGGSHGPHPALRRAKAHRARFLLASTSEVYGDPQVHPQPETYWGHVNPIGPRGVYDEAKRYAEALTMAYHRQQGVATSIIRIFNTYGPRMRPHDGRAIPTFMRQALRNRPITVFGDGSQTRSFCYVDDLIRGMIALAESGQHHPINIGNPNEFTLLQLAEEVIEVTASSSEIVFEALPTDDPQVRQPDITLARELLGWQPEVDLREGLRRTIEQAGATALIGAAV